MESTTNKMTKTQVFNVIILDKSGSMNSIRTAAIDGFNETLAGIKKAQERYGDTQNHFVSLLTFCDCEKKYVFDKVSASEAPTLTLDDYQPCCCTPLYDAMGFALTSMRSYVNAIEDHVVVVTIITDGLENSSKEYSGTTIKQLVEDLKKEGWTFTYMGANQDAVEIAFNLSIRNSRNFRASLSGTRSVMAKDANTRMNFFERLAELKEEEGRALMGCSMVMPTMLPEERSARYAQMADEAFDQEENNNA